MTSTETRNPLSREIAAYEKLQNDLEEKCLGKWVVFHGGEHVKTSEDFEECALWATDKFGDAPFLIKKVGLKVVIPPILMLPHVAC